MKKPSINQFKQFCHLFDMKELKIKCEMDCLEKLVEVDEGKRDSSVQSLRLETQICLRNAKEKEIALKLATKEKDMLLGFGVNEMTETYDFGVDIF